MEKNYTFLHSKVDVLVISIIKLVDFNTKYLNKLEEKTERDSQVFTCWKSFCLV